VTYRISWTDTHSCWRIKAPGTDDVVQGRHLRALVESWRRTHPTDSLYRHWPETGWTLLDPAQDSAIEPEESETETEEEELLPW